MQERDEGLKILASEASAQRIGRRAFMGGSAIAVISGGVLLSACGNGSSAASGGSASGPAAIEGELNFFHWAAYDRTKLFKRVTAEFGPATNHDTQARNHH